MTAYSGKIQLRRKTAANWVTDNPTLLAGEPGYDTTADRIKFGDGTNTFANLEPSPFTVENLARVETLVALSSSTTAQKLFWDSGNGQVTLPVGSYRFNCLYLLTNMSATSGNSKFSLAGTAVLASILMLATGADAVANAVTAQSGTASLTASLPAASQHAAAVNLTQQSFVTGSFKVTTAGTVIPSVALVTAASVTINVGSFFECWSTGQPTQATVGNWS